MQPEEFVDWLNTVERIFEYRDMPEDRKVKLIAIKLKSILLYGGKILRGKGNEKDGGKLLLGRK